VLRDLPALAADGIRHRRDRVFGCGSYIVMSPYIRRVSLRREVEKATIELLEGLLHAE
jgi:hypothetical protein